METIETRVQEPEEETEKPQDGPDCAAAAQPKLFRDLYSVIKGAPDLTMEDFEAVKTRMNWDKFKNI